MKKARLKGYVHVFSVDYNFIDTANILGIHRYLLKKICGIVMLRLIKKAFIASLCFSRLLTSNVSDHVKCISLNNLICKARATLIHFIPNE